jgi:ABC-2 type transport system ATP-binding protein
MKNAPKTFTYTAQRAPYIATVCALFFMMIAEIGLIALLIAKFVQNELIKFGLIIALVILFLNISSRLLAPLWTKHQLSATSLQLHYGLEFKAEIPRNTIIAARNIRERVALPLAKYEAEKERIVAVFSEQGQVLLLLDQPYPFRVGLFGKSKPANQLLINVDQRDEFLADLEIQASSVEKPVIVVGEKEDKGSGDASVTMLAGNGKGDARVPMRVGDGTGDASVPTLHRATPAPTRVGNLAIRTDNLTRSYKGFVAVDDLSLAVYPGEIYGFLGSNGAGKTTTMKILVGLLQPDAGRAWIADHDVWRESLVAKSAFGYVADHTMLYDRLTGREFLDFLAQIRGMPEQEAGKRIEQLLDILELKDRADTACVTYSFGMKRKLAIAGALIHEPQVLILDEPLNGLDPLSARRLKDLFSELAAGGTAIFLSTHDLATAESICHRVGIIHQGRLLVEGSSSELRQIAGAPGLEEAFLSLTAENEQVPA